MNRNAYHDFSRAPATIDIQRSSVSKDFKTKTTFNVGSLIPVMATEVLPGQTVSLDTAFVMRMSTPIKPVMDNLFMDIFYFFVPNRIIWDDFEEFMGENKDGAWAQTKDIQVPHINAPLSDGFYEKSLADYLAVPTKVANISFNALYARAYWAIWNEWFRDQNLQAPIYFTKDSVDWRASTNTSENAQFMPATAMDSLAIAPVGKFRDYFSSSLPDPQKGPDVTLPFDGTAPVLTNGADFQLFGRYSESSFTDTFNMELTGSTIKYDNNGKLLNQVGVYGTELNTSFSEPSPPLSYPEGQHIADLSLTNANITSTINDLRMAFAMQRYYEQLSRGGSRYREIIKSFFGVTSQDSRMQVPEYLGGKRVPVVIQQVVQTSATNNEDGSETPQGNTAAFSYTGDRDSSFTKSFPEHGILLGLVCVRQEHTYQQGIEREMSRRDLFDYYNPMFANIGEQPIFNKEIYAQGTSEDDEIFGYQEAWAEYRYNHSHVTGEFRSNSSKTLDYWHYADYYESLPILSDSWIREKPDYVNRTLAVSDTLADQCHLDFFAKTKTVLPMPLYSVPVGLGGRN